MKQFIGITQDLEETAHSVDTDLQGMQICTEFGPFKSSEDASEWMEFMMKRSEEVLPSTLVPMISKGSAWYGYTIQNAADEIH